MNSPPMQNDQEQSSALHPQFLKLYRRLLETLQSSERSTRTAVRRRVTGTPLAAAGALLGAGMQRPPRMGAAEERGGRAPSPAAQHSGAAALTMRPPARMGVVGERGGPVRRKAPFAGSRRWPCTALCAAPRNVWNVRSLRRLGLRLAWYAANVCGCCRRRASCIWEGDVPWGGWRREPPEVGPGPIGCARLQAQGLVRAAAPRCGAEPGPTQRSNPGKTVTRPRGRRRLSLGHA